MTNSRIKKALASQFGNPHGVLGGIAGWIMAHRSSNRARNAWAIEQLGVEPHHRVLEIGFGPGLALEALSHKISSGQICGIDRSERMVAQAARRNYQGIREGKIQLRQASLEDLMRGAVDLGPAFDRIVTINSAMFWTDLDEGTAHLANLLVPDGIVAIMHQPRLAPATDEEAQKAARKYADSVAKAGLEAIEIRIMESLSPAPVCVLATNSETIY